MTQLASSPLIGGQGIYDISTTQFHNVGERMETTDGRSFRYGQATSLVTVGNLLQSPAVIANHQTLTPSIAALGATSVSVTLGATGGVVNLYSNGYVGVNTTPGNGYLYLVAGHTQLTASVANTINLADSIQVATTALSIMDLVLNPYKGVIQMPVGVNTGTAVGIATAALTAASYGWIQTHGPAMPLSSGTGVVGLAVTGQAAVVAGSVNTNVATATLVIGYAMKVGVDAKNVPTYLVID